MTVDILSLCIGGGGVIALQIAWKLRRRRRRTSMARWSADPTRPAEHQFLSVEVVATFDGLRFRKVGTDDWHWVGGDINGNKFQRWERSTWKRDGVFNCFHLQTFESDAVEAARSHADELEARLVRDMHWDASREDLDRQRAAFVEGGVA